MITIHGYFNIWSKGNNHLTQHEMAIPIIYCSSEIFRQKNFIDIKIQGKVFSWIYDFLEIFYLEHILLAVTHA